MKLFDAKTFNEEAFGRYMKAIPDVKRNKLLECGAVTGNKELRDLFANQTGSFYGTIPYFGGLKQNEPDNYNGVDNLTADTTVTYQQGAFVYGRAKGWVEKDFSYDITGGTDFMANVRNHVLKYWYNVDQDTLLAILEGIFSMTGTKNVEFIDTHTNDISAADSEELSKVGATTLNNTIQKACGDNKGAFKLAIMHSAVSTNLENLNVLGYLKYTDEKGIERDLELASWNGRLVIVDDSMPTEFVAATTGENATPAYMKYTTYILGDGAINLEELGAKVPWEMSRDPKTHGGEDTLWSRKRNAVAVDGLSWLNKSVANFSPTRAEIANGANWSLINDGNPTAANRTYIDHKAIAIARIISKG